MAVYPDDPRMGDILQSGDGGIVVLLGFPFDEGVHRNGGRAGAKGGPDALRKLMKRIGTVVNPEFNISLKGLAISDAGNITTDETVADFLEIAHQALKEKVAKLISDKKIPFVVGGGNDQSYPNASALLETNTAAQTVGVINIDAHLDVRPLIKGKVHSGSPFRQLLEDVRFKGENFREFAAQGNACSAEHVSYIQSKGGKIIWLRELSLGHVGKRFEAELNAMHCDRIFVSFDIDSICGADCPGVSAIGTRGLSAQDALDICFVAGKHPKVFLFDCSEYNPVAEEYRTGRLLAHMFYYFCMGVATRHSSV